jgi:hypothetical protein
MQQHKLQDHLLQSSLKIKQPLAVNEADVQEISAKSQTAVLLSKTGVTLVSAFPFAE